MRPSLEIQDGFFEKPSVIRAAVLNGRFLNHRSEVDGVVYPGINANISPNISYEFTQGIQAILETEIEPKYVFARAMVYGERAPHKVHSDKIMGDFSAHVYLAEEWPEDAGTSFWRHETEGYVHDETTDISKISLTTFKGWVRYLLCPGKFNRLLIHQAELWHMAEPYTGWGRKPSDARLVLTCFFNVK